MFFFFLLLFSFLFECVNRELLLHEASLMYETKTFWFFIYTGRVCTINASYTLQFSPKGACNQQNYCNTHRTRQTIKKKKTRLNINACVECVLRNEPVRHRNRQSAPIDPEHDYIETFFTTTDVSGHVPAPGQPSGERDRLPGPGTWTEQPHDT